MSTGGNDEINVLKLSIHGVLIGYLAGFKNARTVLSIADSFKNDLDRPTFSLITHPAFPNANKLMASRRDDSAADARHTTADFVCARRAVFVGAAARTAVVADVDKVNIVDTGARVVV